MYENVCDNCVGRIYILSVIMYLFGAINLSK
jgi:hypothetical protein